jgi:hypothetical protein
LLSTSALVLLLWPATQASAQEAAPRKRANELTLAGLRPGRDALATALKRYKAKYIDAHLSSSDEKEWLDPCTGRSLSLELDSHSVIQAISVSSLTPQDGKCANQRFGAIPVQDWVTGRGLHLGDTQDRVIQLYGDPNSTGPSVEGGRQLEFLHYEFDWAGTNVPQVMEIHCARESGRVVEMILAFPSL